MAKPKTSKLRSALSKLSAMSRQRATLGIGAAGIVAVAGILLVQSSQAAVYTLAMEAEDGVAAGAAAKASVNGASGDSAVTFGGGTVTCDQAGIQKLVDSVSIDKIKANMQELVQDNSKPIPNELISRHVSQPGNQIKVDWAKQQFASWGLEVIDQPFSSGGYDLENSVGRLKGTDPNTLYAVGGHIDSTNSNSTDDRSEPAPGADDNASGTVAVMEAGRVLKAFQPCMKASVDFVGFNDEEEEMGGSEKYVEELSGKTFKGLVNLDMIGYSDGSSGACIEHAYNDANRPYEKPLFDKWTESNTKYGLNLPLRPGTYSDSDIDSISFWNENQPSIFNGECDWDEYPGYHKTTDNTKYEDFEQITKIAKLAVATLAEMSMQ